VGQQTRLADIYPDDAWLFLRCIFQIAYSLVRAMSRGKLKPKITDISRTPPTKEELKALHDALATELHPVTAAILSAVLVEHELEVELRRCLKCSDDAWEELVSDIGPFRDFHAKIMMGRALRMYDDGMRLNFNIVRNIRNQFAHSKRLVDFKNELIIKELKKAKPVPGEHKYFHFVTHNESGPQYAYISLCMLLVVSLMRRGTKAKQAQTRRIKRQVLKSSPWAKGLWNALIPPLGGPGLPPLFPPASRNGDPKSEAPQGPLGETLKKLTNNDRTSDK
jgi:hypothetical protein